MLRPFVAILAGPSLPPLLVPPRPHTTLVRFATLADLLERAAIEPPLCVVADGAALAPDGVARIRVACPDTTVCLVGADGPCGADVVLVPDAGLPDRLAAMIRFALGEAMRCGPRTTATGVIHVDERWTLSVIDVGEGGVCAASPPDEIIGDSRLRIELDEGPTIVACGHEIRRTSSRIVLALNALCTGERTALRRWMLGHGSGLARVTHPPRARARPATRTPPSSPRAPGSTMTNRGPRPP